MWYVHRGPFPRNCLEQRSPKPKVRLPSVGYGTDVKISPCHRNVRTSSFAFKLCEPLWVSSLRMVLWATMSVWATLSVWATVSVWATMSMWATTSVSHCKCVNHHECEPQWACEPPWVCEPPQMCEPPWVCEPLRVCEPPWVSEPLHVHEPPRVCGATMSVWATVNVWATTSVWATVSLLIKNGLLVSRLTCSAEPAACWRQSAAQCHRSSPSPQTAASLLASQTPGLAVDIVWMNCGSHGCDEMTSAPTNTSLTLDCPRIQR